MLSHVKKIYSLYINNSRLPPLYIFCVSEQHIFLIVCNTDWTVAQKRCIIIWYANYSSQLDKRSQCHTSTHTFWWTTIVIKEKMITVTNNYSDIQDRALGARYVRYKWCANEPCMRSRSLIFLLEQIVRLTNKSVVCITFYLFYSSCIYWQKNVNNILLPTRNKVSQREKKSYIKIVILIFIRFRI